MTKRKEDFNVGATKLLKNSHLNLHKSPYFDGDKTEDNTSVISGEKDDASNTTHKHQQGIVTAGSEGSPSSSAAAINPGSTDQLNAEYFDQSCTTLAQSLLGKLLVRKVNGKRISGIIVETESYLGGPDVASHSYNGKRTPRNEPMYMPPGTAYVYSIYGMYYCFNISSKEEGSCVLIRALEAVEGQHDMAIQRQNKRKNLTPLKEFQLCNGPSKLCQSLSITKELCNKQNLSKSDLFWLEPGNNVDNNKIVHCQRIGIESAGAEWANKPLRYYVSNKSVSIRNKEAERIQN